jgi:hypothetical protein
VKRLVTLYALGGVGLLIGSLWMHDPHISRVRQSAGLAYVHSYPFLEVGFWLAVFALELAFLRALLSPQRAASPLWVALAGAFLLLVAFFLMLFGYSHPPPPRSMHVLWLVVGSVLFMAAALAQLFKRRFR